MNKNKYYIWCDLVLPLNKYCIKTLCKDCFLFRHRHDFKNQRAGSVRKLLYINPNKVLFLTSETEEV